MKPKEKAKELFDKMMYHIMYNCQPTLSEMVAKECALIAVYEIIKSNPMVGQYPIFYSDINYWQEVKQELEKL